MTDDRPTTEQVFSDLSRQLRDGRTVDEIYVLVSQAALTTLPGCDHAGIGLLEGDKFRTGAATDDLVYEIDRMQDELGEGPCLDASVDERIKADDDLRDGSEWPRLGPMLLERTPVRSTLAIPLIHEGRRSGALNLFADRPHAFSAADRDTAAVLAAFASVAVAAASERSRADQLQAGLTTNREIGAAVGILMATHGIGQQEAFAILSQASQRLNRKLRDIAAGIVRGDESPG